MKKSYISAAWCVLGWTILIRPLQSDEKEGVLSSVLSRLIYAWS